MKNPEISVIMGVYNQMDKEALLAAVRSILGQTFTDFEFIIWDDGSPPEAARAVRELGKLDSRIIVAGRGDNHGLASSLNGCIRLARGRYIARMDADDISLPERLKRQRSFLEDHPEYGWCGTCAELFDEDGTWGLRPMPTEPSLRDYLRYSPYIHPSVMFRAELFAGREGYLEAEETLRCEDYEIFLRLAKQGQKGYNLPETLFRYRETRESYRKRKAKHRLNEARVRYRNYKKMGVLFPAGWLYALRPIAACLIPAGLLSAVKRSEGMQMRRREQKKIKAPESGRPGQMNALPGQHAAQTAKEAEARRVGQAG